MKVKLKDLLVVTHTRGGYGEARRLIRGGGALIDGKIQEDVEKVVDIPPHGVVVSAGRKNHAHVGIVVTSLDLTDKDLQELAKREED